MQTDTNKKKPYSFSYIFQIANLVESILVPSEAAYCALCIHCIHFLQIMSNKYFQTCYVINYWGLLSPRLHQWPVKEFPVAAKLATCIGAIGDDCHTLCSDPGLCLYIPQYKIVFCDFRNFWAVVHWRYYGSGSLLSQSVATSKTLEKK